jgi:hypothetical protein
MRPKAAEGTLVRRSLIMHEGARQRLDALRANTEAASDSEIVRKALLYYEQLLDDQDRGRELLIRDADEHDSALPVLTEDDEGLPETEGALIKRNLVLHEKSALRLDALRIATNAPSDSELVRAALVLYEFLVDSALAGKRLIVRDHKLKRETEYFIPVSRAKPPKRRPRHLQLVDRLRHG